MVLERSNAVGASINETRRENENRDRGIALEFRNIRERDIKNVYDSMNSRFDSLERKSDHHQEFMVSRWEGVHTRINAAYSRFNGRFGDVDDRIGSLEKSTNSRFDSLETKTDSRFDAMESQMDPMQVLFRNSKVYHVTQKVTPLPGYDRLPVPKCFPKTAYELICLKDEKNCQWKYLAPVLHCG